MNPAAVAPSSRVDQLFARLQVARGRSEELFKIVRPAALYDRPVPERHRIIFYLGHLEAFDWNLLREPLGLSSFDPDFDKLFAFGIDPVEGGLPTDQPKDWPSVDRVRDYNKRLREQLDAAIRTAAAKDPTSRAPRTWPPARSRHRTSPDARRNALLHAAPVARRPQIQPANALRHPRRRRAASHCVEIPAGTATLGLARGEDGPFGWDNEFEEHRVEVPAFAIDAYNVTNRDYLRFVRDGGYERRSLWSDSGWEWITSQEHRYPVVLDSVRGFLALSHHVCGNFRCRSTGLCTSATMKRRPMRAGPEKNCRAKRNGIARRTALAAASNARTPGARKRPPRGTAILILSAGIRFPRDRTRRATATSASPILWGMAGNGRARRLRLSRDSSHFRSIPGIPRISSMASTS